MGKITQQLRRLALLPDATGVSDTQLLECFVTERDEAAFEALVRRHGRMVWGVCCRTLRSHHDAEDAFQATFLVLVRKAASIASRELLGNWLYGVAHRTALKARTLAARTHGREMQVATMPDVQAPQDEVWRDLEPLLDQELSRLPAKYRSVLLLCDLEGKTRKEAARQLHVPEGTVAGHLARARGLLAKRLSRHGPLLSSGALAAMLAANGASAAVPVSVMASTIKVTCFIAAGGAVTQIVSGQVAALTKGALQAMLLTKLKAVAACLLAVGALGVGGVVARQTVFSPSEAGDPVTVLQARADQLQKVDTPPRQDKAAAPKPIETEKRVDFEFRDAPWQQVIEWYSEISGLPYVGTAKPKGSLTGFHPKSKRQYTINEITDILNEALLEQRCLLIRRAATFTIVSADEPIDLTFVASVHLDDLQKRAKTEIVRVTVPLTNLSAKEFAPSVKKMMGPFGQVIPLEQSHQLILIDTVANLLVIRETLKSAEDRFAPTQQKAKDK
jgi:RNA polymerase sigma factor (sigma-70 family)